MVYKKWIETIEERESKNGKFNNSQAMGNEFKKKTAGYGRRNQWSCLWEIAKIEKNSWCF